MKLKVIDYSKDISKLNKAQILSLRDISKQNLKRLKDQLADEEAFHDALVNHLKELKKKEHVVYTMEGGLKVISGDD